MGGGSGVNITLIQKKREFDLDRSAATLQVAGTFQVVTNDEITHRKYLNNRPLVRGE